MEGVAGIADWARCRLSRRVKGPITRFAGARFNTEEDMARLATWVKGVEVPPERSVPDA
jgi:hypothetical protein